MPVLFYFPKPGHRIQIAYLFYIFDQHPVPPGKEPGCLDVPLQFEDLYQQHKDRVYNLALQYVQNQQDAEEITQDVFVAIFRSLDGFRQDSVITTWIYRITVNRSLDFLRRRKRQKRLSLISGLFTAGHREPGPAAAHFDHPGAHLEQKEALAAIFRCINQLPERQRTAIILARIEQLPQAEIAAIMQLSLKAVESLLQRAKNNLYQKLRNEGK